MLSRILVIALHYYNLLAVIVKIRNMLSSFSYSEYCNKGAILESVSQKYSFATTLDLKVI